MILHADDDTFYDTVLDAPVVVLVEFWATWCGPCRALEPHLKRLAAQHEGRVRVVKVNIAEAPSTVDTYEVQAVPTFMFIDGSEIVWQRAGAIPPHQLEELILTYT